MKKEFDRLIFEFSGFLVKKAKPGATPNLEIALFPINLQEEKMPIKVASIKIELPRIPSFSIKEQLNKFKLDKIKSFFIDKAFLEKLWKLV